MVTKIFSYTQWPTKTNNNLLSLFFLIVYFLGKVEGINDKDDNIQIQVNSTPYSLEFYLDESYDDYVLENITCKSIKNVEVTANEMNICEKLDPCSSYLVMVVIRASSSKNSYTFEKTLDAKTDYSEPDVNINEVISSIDYINISWTAIDGTCVSKYIIEVKSIEKELHYEIYDKRELQVKDLNPCLNHNITLKVIDVNQVLLTNLTSSAKTDYAEPGDLSISFIDDSNGHKKVRWEPPMYKTCIDSYFIEWFLKNCSSSKKELMNEESDCEWNASITDSNVIEYILRDLQGCEEYGFLMFINNNKTAKANDEFTSPEQVPDTVVGQNLVIGNTTIDIYWQPPKKHKKCVKSYLVTITGPLQSEITKKEKRTNETYIFFKNLNPCGYYNLSIVAELNNTSFGTTWNSSFVLNEDIPSEVQNTKVNASSYELEIFWDAPAIAYLCVSVYRISGWTEKGISVPIFDKTTTNTSIKIEGLNSCQAYIVQIIPTTLSGKIDGSLQQIETLTAAVVAQAPNNFQVVGLYPNRLELSAQELDSGNKCETISARFVCEAFNGFDVLYKTAEQYVNDGQVGGISFQALLSPLSPYIEYRCQVSLFNIAGWSYNKSLIQRTEPYFPERPEQISLDTSSNTSLTFIWQRPKYANGNINVYKTYLQMYEPNYFVPSSCTPTQSKSELRETSKAEQAFSDLQPFTKYSIQVAAQNEYGIGEYTRPFIVTTKPWVSEPVAYLASETEGPYDFITEYRASVVVSWLVPCKSNGIIEYFQLEFLGDRTNYTSEAFYRSLAPIFNDDGFMRYNETHIKPEYNYTVNVFIKTKEVEQFSVGMRTKFEAPAGIPKVPHDGILNQTKVNAYDSNNPTKTAVVRFPKEILESESGTIVYMALLLSEKNCNSEPQLRYGAINALLEWPDTLSWYNAYENSTTNCIHQYQTTPLHWKPSVAFIAKNKNRGLRFTPKENEIVYIIGTDVCLDREIQYCNGPLKPDTEYNLVFRLFTKSGYRDLYVLEFKTDSLIQVTLILVSVCSCLLFAFMTGLIYLWITKRIQWNRQSCNSIGDSFGDIIPKNFATYYRDIAKPEKIVREFKELSGVAMDLSCSASEVGCNKNRYTDIYPYDKNRVILDIDVDGSDYINASFIDGYNRKKEYIATQGPKAESTLDFWRMVLQYNVRVIVMLTQLREGDVIKCHQYFPFQTNGLCVTIKKKESFDLYDRAEINAVHEKYGVKQKVVHYYFKKWPDHDCPTDANQLISFVKKVKSEKIPRYSPIVVHCSAGVGRTGTFIGLDIIMQRLKSEYKINIYETVKKLRFQRMKMVQTLAQYTFLYTCTYELVKHKKTKQSNYKNKGGKTVSFQDDHEIKMNHACENENSLTINNNDVCDKTFTGKNTFRNSQSGKILAENDIRNQ